MSTDNSEDVVFDTEEDDDAADAALPQHRCWTVAVIDDDAGVHQATKFALSRVPILGRPLRFLHANSSAEAIELLRNNSDIAVILLDVVMESDDAGLKLVKVIREDMGITEARIVLRTGQPGYAPEMDVIRDYDINDYRTKSELSRNRLYTAMTAAIRSYQQIHTINANRRGLDMIIHASGKLMMQRGFTEFAAGLITQIAGLLSLPPEGVVCAHDLRASGGETRVIAAAGHFEPCINQPLAALDKPEVAAALQRALAERRNFHENRATTLFFPAESGHDMVAYIENDTPLSDMDRHLLEIFCDNISISLENVVLFGELQDYAYKDAALGIPNQTAFARQVAQDYRKGLTGGTLALLGLDNFSAFNDKHGATYGDELLTAIHQRLAGVLPNEAFIARVGHDIFGLLDHSGKLQVGMLTEALTEPFQIKDAAITVSVQAKAASLAALAARASAEAALASLRQAVKSRADWAALFG